MFIQIDRFVNKKASDSNKHVQINRFYFQDFTDRVIGMSGLFEPVQQLSVRAVPQWTLRMQRLLLKIGTLPCVQVTIYV